MSGVRKLGWFKRTFRPVTKGGIRGSVFTLFSGSVGAGVLGLPKVVSSFGLLTGALMIIGVAFLAYSSYDALFQAMIKCNKKRFPNVVNYYLGERNARLFALCIIGVQFFVNSVFGCIGSQKKILRHFPKRSIYSSN